MILGEMEMDVARAKPPRPGGKPSVLQATGTHLSSQRGGGRQLPGGESRSASFAVDDIHQARIT